MELEKLYGQRQKVKDNLRVEEELGAIEGGKWECGNGAERYQEMCVRYCGQCVSGTVGSLAGKVERAQETISKMEEQRKWKNVNNEEGRKNYRRLRNELKRATDSAKQEYLDSTRDAIVEFQRTGRCDLM
jgi:type I site-specific restriction endonuclease